MKFLNALVAASALLASQAALSAPEALLTKSAGGGFAPAWLVQSSQCQIYSNKVVITRFNGGIKSTQQIAIQIDAPSVAKINAQIAEAAQGEMEDGDVAIADAPETTYTAKGNVLLKHIALSDVIIKQNTSMAAYNLVNVIDGLCK